MNAGTPYTRNPLMEGFTENYFETKDGVRLRYLHKGSGIPFIMIHGYGGNADNWSLNAPAFAEEYSVYALDLRGCGFSDASHGAHIARLAADLNEFIVWLGAPKVNLIAWSMGCCVLWSYIELFGQEAVNKIIFDDQPPALVANPRYTREEVLTCGGNRMDPWLLINAAMDYGMDSSEMSSKFFQTFLACFERGVLSYPPEVWADIPDGYLEKMKLLPPNPPSNKEFLSNLLRDALFLDMRDIIPTITVPAMYMTGDESHATTIECGEWMRDNTKNCTWVRFAKEEFGNHNICQTCYRKFNETVLEFLKS